MGCDQCTLPEPPLWYEQDMNETIKAYARSYVLPVKLHYPSLHEAMKVWGQENTDADL